MKPLQALEGAHALGYRLCLREFEDRQRAGKLLGPDWRLLASRLRAGAISSAVREGTSSCQQPQGTLCV